ncbi:MULTISPECIES: NAD(P)H-binding protein [unclassified Vibrio]|uniref:NAD(P)H-binding protein n=1 Tax=Vibrio sp. HB236076 TaxID=3232307 RepID=A0AB39HEQ2_9VIBR|nr:NAD(P)H-binding protein [Vibrio sp. HB161653]MDP5254069.1 NAD(P)H-binding protein [Vibrio sp. HB161653]
MTAIECIKWFASDERLIQMGIGGKVSAHLNKQKIVFLGATGAVGSVAFDRILRFSEVIDVLSLGRRAIDVKKSIAKVKSRVIDIHDVNTYSALINGYTTAICTLGVGEPSKLSKTEFVKIDRSAVLAFAKVCKSKGVKHFQLLSSVGVNKKSRNFYLRTKGELIDKLIQLDFERLSIFQPSMILTPQNRYGLTQALTLMVWPKLDFLLRGELRQYRGIKVELLGNAIANNLLLAKRGIEYLQYDEFMSLQ